MKRHRIVSVLAIIIVCAGLSGCLLTQREGEVDRLPALVQAGARAGVALAYARGDVQADDLARIEGVASAVEAVLSDPGDLTGYATLLQVVGGAENEHVVALGEVVKLLAVEMRVEDWTGGLRARDRALLVAVAAGIREGVSLCRQMGPVE